MADFVIRPAGDPDWDNALFLSGDLPLNAVDAVALGVAMGTDYEIGRLGSLATFQVTDVPAAMAAPTLLAQTDQLEITLLFAPDDGGQSITGYDLRYRSGAGDWTQVDGITSPYILTGLAEDTTVEVQARAVNGNGPAPWSPTASATTLTAGDTTAPVVGSISYADGNLSVDLTEESGAATAVWAVHDPGATPGFTVAGGWSGARYEVGTFEVTAGGDSDTITITPTTPAGARELSLYFYDADGNLSDVERLAVTITHPAASLYDFSTADAGDWVSNFRASVANTPSKFSVGIASAGATRFALRLDDKFTMAEGVDYDITFRIHSTVAETVVLTCASNNGLTSMAVSGPDVQLSTNPQAPTEVTLTANRPAGTQFWIGVNQTFSAAQDLQIVAAQCSIMEA